ncbi:MAG: hypothetical protein K6G10_07030 [Butyrivibrio sp.]|nr:hypothetical protein [Butyrivibrio sp.]
MLPKYIEQKIKQQHRYIALAEKLSFDIIEWYSKNLDASNLSDGDDIEEIDCEGVRCILPQAIEHNLLLAKKALN